VHTQTESENTGVSLAQTRLVKLKQTQLIRLLIRPRNLQPALSTINLLKLVTSTTTTTTTSYDFCILQGNVATVRKRGG